MKRKSRLQTNQDLQGLLFLIPLLIGLLLFFVIPIVKSFQFSISEVGVGAQGYTLSPYGFGHYYAALFKEPDYLQIVTKSLGNMAFSVPLILLFSFFMASILNQKFRCKAVFRMILFLPVIIASSAMIAVNTGDSLQQQMGNSEMYKNTFGTGAMSISSQIGRYFINSGFSTDAVEMVTGFVDRVYEVINLSGIQILIFLTGMQSISPSLYEASDIEGATAWENFWKITFPMVSPLILTATVYTIIDSFTASSNQVMETIKSTAFTRQEFGLSSAMSWIYFVIIAAIIGIVSLIISKRVFYYD